MRTLSREDIEDLLVGAKIMGTGGGGETEWAKPLIEEVYQKKKEFRLIGVDEVPDSEIVTIVSRVGGGITKEQVDKVKDLHKSSEKPEFTAFRLLGEYMGKEPYAVIPAELGAGNTLIAMYTAAMLDKPSVDADCCGRAKPEIPISTTNIANVLVTPACLVTMFGEVLYLAKAASDERAEDILRPVAAASGGTCGVCRCPMNGSVLRNSVVAGSVTLCMEIGKAIREESKAHKNPIDSILRTVDGIKFFEGKVSQFKREEHGAFMWGDFTIEGTGKFAPHSLKIWFKNEHLISWFDGKPYVTCPDSICVVDANTGLGLSNWGRDFSQGREVVAFGVRAHPLFRTQKGLDIFSPKFFGFDIPYMPIEDIVKS